MTNVLIEWICSGRKIKTDDKMRTAQNAITVENSSRNINNEISFTKIPNVDVFLFSPNE